MNKSGLVDAVKEQLGVSTSRAREIVDAVFDEVQQAVATGQRVSLTGLGVFERGREAAQPVFRPAKRLTDATLAPMFKPAKALTGAVAGVAIGAAARAAGRAAGVVGGRRGERSGADEPVAAGVAEPTRREEGAAAKRAAAPVRKAAKKTAPVRPVEMTPTEAVAEATPVVQPTAMAKKAAAKTAPAKKGPAKKGPAKKAPAKKTAGARKALAEPDRVVHAPDERDVSADALAAVNAELARPAPAEEPPTLLDGTPEPADVPVAIPEEDTLAYTSGPESDQRELTEPIGEQVEQPPTTGES